MINRNGIRKKMSFSFQFLVSPLKKLRISFPGMNSTYILDLSTQLRGPHSVERTSFAKFSCESTSTVTMSLSKPCGGRGNSHGDDTRGIGGVSGSTKYIMKVFYLSSINQMGKEHHKNAMVTRLNTASSISGQTPHKTKNDADNLIYIVKSATFYRGGRKIHSNPSISKIQSQMWYHYFQYTRCHLMSLVSHCQHGFCQSLLI